MDVSQIENDDIQVLLERFQIEKRQLETNLELEQRLEQISLLCFMRNVASIVDKLFFVTVKICDTVSDLSVFDVCTNVNNKSCSFYVIQIHTSQLLQKLMNNNWIANVCIKNSNEHVCKTIHLRKLMPSDTCNIVVPFSNSLTESTIEIRLISKIDTQFWCNFKISTIKTNISYHFLPLYKYLKPKLYSPLFEISKLYNDNIKLKKPEPVLEYKIRCDKDIRQFFEIVLKNCVHKLNVAHMQTLAGTPDGVMDIELVVRGKKVGLVLDTGNKILKICANSDICYLVKSYLIENFKDESNREVNHLVLVKLQSLKRQLNIVKSQGIINFEHLKVIYEEYNNIVSELPL